MADGAERKLIMIGKDKSEYYLTDYKIGYEEGVIVVIDCIYSPVALKKVQNDLLKKGINAARVAQVRINQFSFSYPGYGTFYRVYDKYLDGKGVTVAENNVDTNKENKVALGKTSGKAYAMAVSGLKKERQIIQQGSINEIKQLLENGFDPNGDMWQEVESDKIERPLTVAADRTDSEADAVLEMLLNAGADPKLSPGMLYYYVMSHRPDISKDLLKKLIANGADASAGLAAALCSGEPYVSDDIITFLIDSGASVNTYYDLESQDPDAGPNLLFKAMESKTKAEFIKILVQRGAKAAEPWEVNDGEKDELVEYTAREYAKKQGYDEDIVALLQGDNPPTQEQPSPLDKFLYNMNEQIALRQSTQEVYGVKIKGLQLGLSCKSYEEVKSIGERLKTRYVFVPGLYKNGCWIDLEENMILKRYFVIGEIFELARDLRENFGLIFSDEELESLTPEKIVPLLIASELNNRKNNFEPRPLIFSSNRNDLNTADAFVVGIRIYLNTACKLFKYDIPNRFFGTNDLEASEFAQAIIDHYSIPSLDGKVDGWFYRNRKEGWQLEIRSKDKLLSVYAITKQSSIKFD